MTDTTEPRAIPPAEDASLPQRVERINFAAAMGALGDALVFLAATVGGVRPGPAHILSFIVAIALNYQLNIRVAVAAAARTRDVRLYGHLLVVSLLALFLRGGVLSLLTNVWGWPPSVAIFVAIGATLAVTLPGYEFSLSSHAWRLGSGTRWKALAVGLVAYAFALRLIYQGQVELLPEEAYYWSYSRHLASGYLDHPPMVAWLIRFGTAIFGTTQLGVRVCALLCAAATAFFTYRLTRNLYGVKSAWSAMVLSQVLPFFFMAGLVMTPDTPLVAAWAAELYFLERALVAGRPRAWWGAGLCLGVGLLSKYSMGLLGLAALVFVLLDPQSRRWLRRWQPYAAALIALAIFSPVIAWNAENEWVSFVFQTTRRLSGETQFSLHKLILAALVLMTPTGLLAAAALLRRRPPEEGGGGRDGGVARRKWRFLQVAVGVPLAVFVAISLRHNVKFDWTAEVWLAALPALAFVATSSGDKLPRTLLAKIRAAWMPTILALLVIFAAGLHFLVLGLPGLGYGERMELMPMGWSDLAQQINTIAKEIGETTGAEPLVVGMDRYAIASEVAFYASDPAAGGPQTSGAHLFGWTALMYERWVPLQSQAGRTLLLVAWKSQDLTDRCVAAHAERLGPVQDGVLVRDGRVIRRYYYRAVFGYRNFAKCL